MVYIPDIVDYKPFYIQTDADGQAIDTRQWGLVAKSNPFPILPNPKEPFKNDWHDEDGDDEYVDSMRYASIEFDVQFYIKAYATETMSAEGVLRQQIEDFFSKIKNGDFAIYDSYTGIGRKKVRYASYSEESFKRSLLSRGDWARVIFTITFKANDPITRIVLNAEGKLVEA